MIWKIAQAVQRVSCAVAYAAAAIASLLQATIWLSDGKFPLQRMHCSVDDVEILSHSATVGIELLKPSVDDICSVESTPGLFQEI